MAFGVLRAGAPGSDCERLVDRLPAEIDTDVRLVERADDTAVWGDPAIVLRCGVPRPQGWRVGVVPAEINGVAWYFRPAGAVVEWTAVDRGTYVTVTVPAEYEGQGARFFTELADPIRDTFDEQPLDPAPPPQPPLVSASPSPAG